MLVYYGENIKLCFCILSVYERQNLSTLESMYVLQSAVYVPFTTLKCHYKSGYLFFKGYLFVNVQ